AAQGPLAAATTPTAPPPFTVVEASITEMQHAMAQKRVTSRELVLQYLARIAFYEDQLNAAMTVSRDSLRQAETLDRERAQGKVRAPLHAIPRPRKDNIPTPDSPTTGGPLAFAALVPPYEATPTKNLRAAGAIITAKPMMPEPPTWRAAAPTAMPANYNA